MAAQEKAPEERISQFDPAVFPEMSAFLGVNALQYVKEIEEEEHRDREKMQKGFNSQMRSEAKRLKTFVTYTTFSSWMPQEMAEAGFYFTGTKSGIQCFCCSLILFGTSLQSSPMGHHKKFHPDCEFLLGKDVGNIPKYDIRVQNPEDTLRKDDKARYQDEKARLESFENWPFYAQGTSPRELSAAGFVFTGKRDTVQCFSCGGCLGNWEDDDDPWKEHAKWFPKCEFLQSKKSLEEITQYIQSYKGFVDVTETTSESNLEESTAVSSIVPEVAQGEAQWFQEAESLSERLRKVYTSAPFCHVSLLELSSCLATDQWLDCDLSFALKHITNPVQEPVVLPEVFANLNSVMCVEGEAGSGKTILLKKIALLWASGCCPLLHRFRLVFYLSLGSTRPEQGLASVIHDQLLETNVSVTEMGLRNIIQQLKNQVLFLLDDYKEMCSVPQVIARMIQKKHLSRTCLVITVHTNRAKNIRRYLDTIIEIKAFPFYNTISILKKLFPGDLTRLRKLMVDLGMNQTWQGIQKTPLFVAAVCASWLQNRFHWSFHSVAVFKSYMECLFLKHKTAADLLKATVSSCGELALKGFFSSCFEFSDEDLIEAGIDEEEDLAMYLMNKFTAQRLRPVYQFLNPAFQEFLAGMRLTELLDSDRQEDQDLGLHYLKQINSTLMAICPYANFLNCVSSHPSTKAGPKIVSHLLLLVDNKETLENISENDDYLKHHPEISELMQCFRLMWQFSPQTYLSVASKHLLALAVKVAYQSNTVAACSPFILQFLQGRTLCLDVLKLQYFFDHPESLLLLRSIQVSIGRNTLFKTDDMPLERILDKSQAPTIDQDYASAFELESEWKQSLVEKQENIKRFHDTRLNAPPAISTGYWKLPSKQYKIPLLEVHVTNTSAADQEMLKFLTEVFSAAQHIELHLNDSRGFIENILPALEQYRASFTKCCISQCELSAIEQELLLTLTSLESLQVSEKTHIQDQLFLSLDKFLCLKELSVNLQQDVFSVISEEFLNLHHMEKLLIQISSKCSSSKLVRLVENSPNLQVFHLECNSFSDFESLVTALASRKKLEEIKLSGHCFNANPFVIVLPNFISLKILNLRFQYIPDKETAEKFAYALGSLNNLEELILPTGDGIHQMAKLIVQQCQHLQCLQVLQFFKTLDDDSVVEIGNIEISTKNHNVHKDSQHRKLP
ncbi:hypothetical protein MJG53_012289 [Ovis ammon polii x Ovis aries]|uniref:Uncharacterized protein n=1 Tax=Ovis ammon polii x Ovis aries TaxID=2918886 RepID=A0ACB9UN20_9CETA|nr:hypothetical protein MJT46_011913 [Ovis ammon polii x Ovis aries]KAI4574113.1 hypothetical protein MJG53_012289 [Ovis ammon polii x Ovis aries]